MHYALCTLHFSPAILTRMNTATRWTLGLLGLLVLLVSPWAWQANPAWLFIIVPALAVWAFWLMLEYLRWAKSLGKK